MFTYDYCYLAMGGGYQQAWQHATAGSAAGTTRDRYDSNGNQVYIKTDGQHLRSLLINAQGRAVRQDVAPTATVTRTWYAYAENNPVGLFGNKPTVKADFRPTQNILSDDFASGSSVYVVQSGDTLPRIADALWGDSSLWYLIADANGLEGTETLDEGLQLQIPQQLTQRNSSSTHKVYNPDIISIPGLIRNADLAAWCILDGQSFMANHSMRIFTAGLATETNTFSFAPTGWPDFEANVITRGDTRANPVMDMFTAELRRLAAADGHEVIESVGAFAQPADRTLRQVYETLRDRILEDLRAAMPIDAIQFYLHGAMIAEGYDDCEGDLLARARAIVGPDVSIGVELDLHCHYTQQMQDSADVIIACKEYPHTDFVERARELYRITLAAARREVRPVTAVYDCRMIGNWSTVAEPMAGFVRRLQSLEGKDGVLSISLGHGFPWADVADVGAKLWVVADGDRSNAAKLAEALGREFWDMREAIATRFLSIGEALDEARGIDGLVVMADVADNAGGGAASDSTFILRAMVEAGVGDAAIGSFWDLGAVHLCRSAGVGATITLRIGGKCGPASGDPIDLDVTVRAIEEDFFQEGLSGAKMPMGTTAWVQTVGGIDILLNTKRTQMYYPNAFTKLGVDLTARRLVAVKSANHFLAGYGPLAKKVLFVTTPGTLSQDYGALPYRKRESNYWPRVADPHG